MAPTLPTPITAPLHATVYPPSEDTYLILDALTADAAFLTTHLSALPSPLILELGPGSGMITSFLYTNTLPLLGRTDCTFLAIDANTHACATTTATLRLSPNPSNSLFLDTLQGDLATCLRPKIVDVLVFNPPYVPSEEVPELQAGGNEGEWEKEGRLLALTYAGGEEGMEVTRRVLEGLGEMLRETGVAYVLFCRQNKPEVVVEGLRVEGWKCECVKESGKTGGWEKLSVWRIWREV